MSGIYADGSAAYHRGADHLFRRWESAHTCSESTFMYVFYLDDYSNKSLVNSRHVTIDHRGLWSSPQCRKCNPEGALRKDIAASEVKEHSIDLHGHC